MTIFKQIYFLFFCVVFKCQFPFDLCETHKNVKPQSGAELVLFPLALPYIIYRCFEKACSFENGLHQDMQLTN